MAQQKMPFRYATRQNFRKIGTIAYAANTTVSLPVDKVGLLCRFFLQFRTTGNGVTLSGAGSLTDLGPWNLISRIKVNLNGAALTLWDTTGYGAFLANMVIKGSYAPDKAGAGATTPNANLFAAPVASGNNVWALSWILPISANQGSNFDTGLINLQSPETVCTVEITWGALTDPAALITAIVGNLYVGYEYFEIPNPSIADPPPVVACRTIEEQIPVTGTGDSVYTVPRGGNLLNLITYLRCNGARTDGYDDVRVMFNKSTQVYRHDMQFIRLRNRLHTGLDWPTGTFLQDFFHGTEPMSAGDNRDFIDTEQLSTLESIVAVSSGTTLGSNNNFQNNVRRILQVFQA